MNNRIYICVTHTNLTINLIFYKFKLQVLFNKHMKSFLLILFVFLSLATFAAKPRAIVLTDIGGDPDDEESMIRFLLYSNEFDIEGLWLGMLYYNNKLNNL